MFFNLINLININLKLKKKYFKTTIKKNEISLIKILIRINLIKYVKKINNEFIIFLNFYEETHGLSIKNLYKPSRICYISKKEISRLMKLQKQVFFISTPKGVTTTINSAEGGVLVAKIY